MSAATDTRPQFCYLDLKLTDRLHPHAVQWQHHFHPKIEKHILCSLPVVLFIHLDSFH